MSLFCLKNTKISAISSVVPKKELSLLDDKNLYNGDKKKISRVINSSGFLKRRTADIKTTASDLCYQAGLDLIENRKINKDEIDGILFLSYTPDYLMPATAYVLHNKLGLKKDCVALDIPQACSGFVIGLYQASMMINAGAERVLLFVGDTFSKFSDMFKNGSAPVFGDAGCAIEVTEDKNSSIYFNIETFSKSYDSLICLNGGFRNPPLKEDFYNDNSYKYNSKMDGAGIFNFTLENVEPNIKKLFEFSNIKSGDVDYYVFHQANKFILENIARKLNIQTDKISTETLTNYGNQCGASIPCTISNILSETLSGGGGGKFLLCGFGAGLSVASAICDIKNIYCSKLIEYKGG